MSVATFIAKGLQAIAEVKSNSRCSNCGRRGRVELVIYFRNAVDVERCGENYAHQTTNILSRDEFSDVSKCGYGI